MEISASSQPTDLVHGEVAVKKRMMGCLFGCFRVTGGDGSEPRGRRAHVQAQLVSSSVAPAADPRVGERRGPPSRNALSAVFLREDEGSQATSSGTNPGAERKQMDRELKYEAIFLKNCGALLGTPNDIRNEPESADSVYQSAIHSAELPPMSESLHFMEVLNAEDCQTPPGSHQSTNLPDALTMSSSWKACDASSQHDSEAVSKSIDSEGVNIESVIDYAIRLTTLDSSSSISNDDIYLDGSKSSPFSTPSKVNAEIQTPATTHAPYLEELRNENIAKAFAQQFNETLNPVEDFENCGALREESCQPDISDEDLKCQKNGSLVSVELSISDECSLFHNSEGSVSSCNKISDSMNPASAEKCLNTEAIVHASRKKVITNSDVDLEFPSLPQWLKPPNLKKAMRDETYTSDRSHSAKSSEEDRPIIGMVAAHWKNTEQENFAPKWWDGNGIPNSTNKYKEDQKVSWHTTPFEERLEKALSDEKLLSQRQCSSGNTSHFSGVEGEESDTAASNRLYVAAFT